MPTPLWAYLVTGYLLMTGYTALRLLLIVTRENLHTPPNRLHLTGPALLLVSAAWPVILPLVARKQREQRRAA